MKNNLFKEYDSYASLVMNLCDSLKSDKKILGYGLEIGTVTKSYYNANKFLFPKMVEMFLGYNLNAAKYVSTKKLFIACFTNFELVYNGEIYKYIEINSTDELFNLSTTMDLEIIKCMFIWKYLKHVLNEHNTFRFNLDELDEYILKQPSYIKSLNHE